MSTAGPSFPTTGASVTGVGTLAWTNPGRVVANDNSYVTASSGTSGSPKTTYYLQGTHYDFAIPAGATINGIQLSIGRKAGYNDSDYKVEDSTVRLIDETGTVVGDNKAATTTKWPTSEGAASYGATNDLWGNTWTAEDINNNSFGAALSAVLTFPDDFTIVASVDYFTITITYTEAAAGGVPKQQMHLARQRSV